MREYIIQEPGRLVLLSAAGTKAIATGASERERDRKREGQSSCPDVTRVSFLVREDWGRGAEWQSLFFAVSACALVLGPTS